MEPITAMLIALAPAISTAISMTVFTIWFRKRRLAEIRELRAMAEEVEKWKAMIQRP